MKTSIARTGAVQTVGSPPNFDEGEIMLVHERLGPGHAEVNVDAVNTAMLAALPEEVALAALGAELRLHRRRSSLAEKRRSFTRLVGRGNISYRGRAYSVRIVCDWSDYFDWLRVDVYTATRRARKDVATAVKGELRAELLASPAGALVAEQWHAARGRPRRYTDFVTLMD